MQKLTREFYIPKGMQKVISATGTDLYMTTTPEHKYPYIAVGFSGKKAKYDFYYRFPSIEKRQEFVARWETRLREIAKSKQERKEKRNVPSTLKEGSILYSSWGYDQTNIDFYQVTKVIGSRSVEIREIAQERTPTAWEQGTTMPKPGVFIGEPMRKLVRDQSTININSYASAWIWGGQPKHFTSYA